MNTHTQINTCLCMHKRYIYAREECNYYNKIKHKTKTFYSQTFKIKRKNTTITFHSQIGDRKINQRGCKYFLSAGKYWNIT